MRRRLSLYVEGRKVDLSDDALVLWNWRQSDLRNPAAVKNSYSQTVTIPGTPNNDDIFGAFFRADRRLAGSAQEDASAQALNVNRLLVRSARLLGAAASYTLPVTATPAGWVTSDIAGQVAFDNTIGATEVTTLTAQVRPGFKLQFSIPAGYAWDNDGFRWLMVFVQGVGYDADGTAIAATPTYFLSRRAYDSAFPLEQVVAAAGYTPNALNTNYEKLGQRELYLEDADDDTAFFMANDDDDPATATAGYIDLTLTATGLQRMEVRFYPMVLNMDWGVSDGYTVGTADGVKLFSGTSMGTLGMAADAWAVQFGTTSGESDTDPDPDPGPDPGPDPPDPGPDPPGPGPDPGPDPEPAPDPVASGNYRTAFDPSRRADFTIYDETGRVQVAGYLKLGKVLEAAGVHSYEVNLFGGLGGFLYGLSYKADGSRMTLADLDYLGGGDGELDFTITAEAVRAAWARLEGDTSQPEMWDVINFAPAYNGIPADFSADKAVIAPADAGLATDVDGYTPKNGKALVNLPAELDEWGAHDLRSYLQRPVVSLWAILQGIVNTADAKGWSVDLSDIDDTAKWTFRDAWITRPLLPSLGTFKQTSGSMEITLNPLGWGTSRTVGQFNVAGVAAGDEVTARMKVRIGFNVPTASAATLYPYAQANGQTLQQVLFVQAVGYASDDTKVAAGPVLPVYYSTGDVTPEQLAEACGYTPDALNTSYQAAERDHGYDLSTGTYYVRQRDLSIELSGVNLARINVEVCAYLVGIYDTSKAIFYHYGDADPLAALFSDRDDIGSSVAVTEAAVTAGSATASGTSADTLRSGALITKAMLLSTEKTPADYLVSTCKTFGFYLVTDDATKTVRVMRRSSFYQDDDLIDLEARVDRTHDIEMDALTFDARWYELRHESVGGAFEKEYQDTEGVQYGIQRVNTGYGFDASVRQLLDGVVFRSCAPVRDRGRKWCHITDGGTYRPAAFLDPGATYTLWNASGESKDVGISVPSDAAVITQYFNGYDIATSRPEFRDGQDKSIDGADVLLLMVASYTMTDFSLSDDTPFMDAVNGGPCWILQPNSAGENVPVFTRYAWHGQDADAMLDFGRPRQIALPSDIFKNAPTLYELGWQQLVRDRFDVNNKVLRCRVNIEGLPAGPELLRRFFWWRGSVWALMAITNYSLTTFDPAECEFVQVRNTGAYTAAQYNLL